MNEIKKNYTVLHAAQRHRTVFTFGGIVVDTMGFGKTLIALFFFNHTTMHTCLRGLDFDDIVVDTMGFGKTYLALLFFDCAIMHISSRKLQSMPWLLILWDLEKHGSPCCSSMMWLFLFHSK